MEELVKEGTVCARRIWLDLIAIINAQGLQKVHVMAKEHAFYQATPHHNLPFALVQIDSAVLLALFRAQCFRNPFVPVGVCVTTMAHAHATTGLWDQIVL
jgi:hypothetical protein